jgi:ketosteroid isomerase-like protein
MVSLVLSLPLAIALAANPAAALLDADRAMDRAIAARDAAAFAALVDEEAIWGGTEGLLDGRAAVARSWSAFMTPGGPILRWTPGEAVISRSGDLGYTLGTWRLEQQAPEGKVRTAEGRYLTVWRKGRDGVFRAVFDMALEPPRPGPPAPRSVVRTLASRARDLEAHTGLWLGPDGQRGSYLSVLRRGRDGTLAQVVDTAVAFAAPKP